MADGRHTATRRVFGAARTALTSFAFAAVAGAVTVLGAFASATPAAAGTTDNVTGWAWSGSIGWISMNCTNQASCATADYGVTIEDTVGFPDRADLKGYAWAETVGWICFGSTCTGTTPEGGATYAQYRANFNGKDNQLWGWAQIVSLGNNGWISLNCDHVGGTPTPLGPDNTGNDCAPSNYNITLNPTTGLFTAGGATDHWAWGSSDEGMGAGWIDFGVVSTTWVLANLGTVTRPEGVYEPTATGQPGTHLYQFPIRFDNFSAGEGQRLECEVSLPDGSKRVIGKVLPAAVRHGTTTLTYDVQVADNVQFNRIWHISVCRIGSANLGAACVTDAACGANRFCDETAGIGKCRQEVVKSNARYPIYTHGNAWSGLSSAAQDQYAAIQCNAGFSGTYFRNPVQCDFTADAAFSLAMRRGIPVEGNCGDLIDNDGNGQTDCADRYCKGISYRCQQLPRLACTWGATGDGINDCTDASYVNGDLCCSRKNQVVDGLECTVGSATDGVFDCNEAGYQSGDLCCAAGNVITKQ